MGRFTDKLPEGLKKFVDPSLPKEMRIMAAKGLVPIPPRDIVLVVFSLTMDGDEEVEKEARETLKAMPEEVIGPVLVDESSPPELLDFIARNTGNESYLEKIILNRTTDDSTIAYLAETLHNGPLVELIASNQVRILRSSAIVEALGQNPSVSPSVMDRVTSFISLYLGTGKQGGVEKEPVSHHKDDVTTLNEEIRESFLDKIGFPEELLEEDEEAIKRTSQGNLLDRVVHMRLPEKLKLALVGNREARRILVRDSNRLVATAVLKNPRLTDSEVIQIAQSRTVDECVLREIAGTRKWAKLYQVKLALVNNPKTPTDVTLNFLRHLRYKDLRSVVWNRDLPGVIISTARKILKEKQDQGV
ncbi:MAG: hypothetical protein KatS3mg078_0374 [Deltaproteobacteria bacterium]|jgi:hypothetical protein|nr:MAG: hypothetical protein KatS3mg078_0374 [Deltaproteobacteria bacterium]